MYCVRSPGTFRENALSPFLGSNSKPSNKPARSSACRLLLTGFLIGQLFDSEDGGNTFLRNVRGLLADYAVLHPRRWKSFKVVRSEVFTAVTMKNAVFWDVAAANCWRWFLARGFFYPKDGGDTFLRNISSHKIYTAPYPRRRHSSFNVSYPAIWLSIQIFT
jgi:hypothetical protein